MIKYTTGNLLDAKTNALVNTVNTVGVMGKGIALQFKKAFPTNFKVYVDACKNNRFQTGELLIVRDINVEGEKLIVNFPTKAHWRNKSKYDYIKSGLKVLRKEILEREIPSIAIPPLGCGNGGLQWERVKGMIVEYLGDLKDIEILVYEPNANIKKQLKQKQPKKEIALTPTRAMLLYALFFYETLGEASNLLVANKMAYFFQRLGVIDFNRLKFKKYIYGPYSEQVSHILYDLNGAYLSGLEQMNIRPFENIELNYKQMSTVSDYVHRELSTEKVTQLKSLIKLVTGFQSALSIETLATVDFILKDKPNASLPEVNAAIQQWNARKKNLFKPAHIKVAYEHLLKYRNKL